MRTISAFDTQQWTNKRISILAFWKKKACCLCDITEGRIIEDKTIGVVNTKMAALWGGKAIYGDAPQLATGLWARSLKDGNVMLTLGGPYCYKSIKFSWL